MAPSNSTESVANRALKPTSNAKRTITTQRSSTIEDMDSSRPAQATDSAMSSTPEPATAAMVDVSSWAQRGLVLENKDLRRTLEMTKSAHAAQLAQIAKRQRTEKEELEVKLEAEICRQQAQQRNLNELAAALQDARKENALLSEKDQALQKQLIARTEDNGKLAGELQHSAAVIRTTEKEIDTMKEKQEELLAREARVAVVLNDQHSKIMNLSQAYRELETDNNQLQTALDTADGELARLKARMSAILDTLARVVQDDKDEEQSAMRIDGKALRDVAHRSPSSVQAGSRRRGRASDQRTLDTQILGGLGVRIDRQSSPLVSNGGDNSPVSRNVVDDSTLDIAIADSSNRNERQPTCVADSQARGSRTKRRRIVSDPDATDAQARPRRFRVKEEPPQSDNMMLDRSAVQVEEERATMLEIENSNNLAPATISTKGIAGQSKLVDGGEESPERAAVESAIDVQDEGQSLRGPREQEKGMFGKSQPTTYARKRKAVDSQPITSDRVGTPTPGETADGTTQEYSTAPAFSTPATGRSKASPNQTSSYITRARTAKSSLNATDSTSYGSPLPKKLSQVGTSQADQESERSPRMVHVKEEAPDSMSDGRPRITGGDDEDDPLCI